MRYRSLLIRRGHPCVLVMALCGAAAVFMPGCDDAPTPAPPPPPTVLVANPISRPVTEYFNYTGTLSAIERAEVRARVSGVLDSIEFTESTTVQKGDLLFTIQKEEYEIAVGLAEAALARAVAARDLAATQVQRTQAGFEAEAVNEIELIEDKAELALAEADVLSAERDLDYANLQLSYTDVRAPITGRIDRNYVDVGNLVGRNEPTLLSTIVLMDEIHVEFDVSESITLRYLESGKNGDAGQRGETEEIEVPVEVALANDEGYPYIGRIDFVDNVLDQTTGTLTVRARLSNESQQLFPGLFARIRVPWETKDDTTVVWEDAVGTGLEGKFLLVLNDKDIVSRRPVILGERQDDGTIVVREGITPDERYIVQGIQKARPGAPVTPKAYERASNDPQPGAPRGEG